LQAAFSGDSRHLWGLSEILCLVGITGDAAGVVALGVDNLCIGALKKAPMAGIRLTISPTPIILELLQQHWPLAVPKHRLMRLGLEAGLRALADLKPNEFRRLVIDDAVTTAGIRER
jgi:hypothetical protein